MSALPSDRTVEDLFARIAEYRAVETSTVLRAGLARARRARSNTADGFPSGTLGGGIGTAELTSVESAAQSRIAGNRRDPLDEHIRRCLAHLEAAVTSLDLLTVAVGNLSNVAFDGQDMNERHCWPCAKAGIDHAHELKRVRVGDTKFDVCQWAYRWFLDLGVMPDVKACREHDERGYTRRRVDPTQPVTVNVS